MLADILEFFFILSSPAFPLCRLLCNDIVDQNHNAHDQHHYNRQCSAKLGLGLDITDEGSRNIDGQQGEVVHQKSICCRIRTQGVCKENAEGGEKTGQQDRNAYVTGSMACARIPAARQISPQEGEAMPSMYKAHSPSKIRY